MKAAVVASLLGSGILFALACDPVELELFRVATPEGEDAGFDAGQPQVVVVPPEPIDARPPVAVVEPVDAAPPQADTGPVIPPECLLCAGDTPLCDTGRNVCVECLSDSDCTGNRGFCDILDTFTCNECVNDDQCNGTEECIREANEPEEGLHCED